MAILPPKIKQHHHSSSPRRHAPLLEVATDLEPLRDLRVLALFDEQNLSIGARDLGYCLQYDLLAQRIGSVTRSARLHVFIAAERGNHRSQEYFKQHGYITHVKTIRRKVLNGAAIRCDSNVDNLFAFWTGVIATTARRQVLLIASGDYGLAGELSRAIRLLPRGRHAQVMTLSLPGSTAQDLDASRNPDITANLEIGLDLLKPDDIPF